MSYPPRKPEKKSFGHLSPRASPTAIRHRLRRPILPGVEAWCSPPEELIVKKLSYYRQGASDKHLRDVASMLRMSPQQIDLGRVREMAVDYELGPILDRVLEAAEDK